jgi:hypothetical protein
MRTRRCGRATPGPSRPDTIRSAPAGSATDPVAPDGEARRKREIVGALRRRARRGTSGRAAGAVPGATASPDSLERPPPRRLPPSPPSSASPSAAPAPAPSPAAPSHLRTSAAPVPPTGPCRAHAAEGPDSAHRLSLAPSQRAGHGAVAGTGSAQPPPGALRRPAGEGARRRARPTAAGGAAPHTIPATAASIGAALAEASRALEDGPSA